MKVLLTGASGFVGSHVLDALYSKGIPTAVLLRPTSDKRFIETLFPRVEPRVGSLADAESLRRAMADATHVIHCAGCVKALRLEEFRKANQLGTRRVVEAANQMQGRIQRLIHVSSLAASRPARADQPAREEDPPQPVSEYGKSKLAGEEEVRGNSRFDYVILRPAAVYGPRDSEFLALFKGVRMPLIPLFGGGRQQLSLLFVRDLAEATVACLTHPDAPGKTFNVASPQVVTTRELMQEIASQLGSHPLAVPLPVGLLWPICLLQEWLARLRKKPAMLTRQKYAEVAAPGWVCDPTRLREGLGVICGTSLKQGIAETIAWYSREGWL